MTERSTVIKEHPYGIERRYRAKAEILAQDMGQALSELYGIDAVRGAAESFARKGTHSAEEIDAALFGTGTLTPMRRIHLLALVAENERVPMAKVVKDYLQLRSMKNWTDQERTAADRETIERFVSRLTAYAHQHA